MREDPAVSVVVAHYRQQTQLDRLLAALEVADPVQGGFEVIVADDGSPVAPQVGRRCYPVRVVGLPRDGFRLAATRNLGAACARGRLLCFLDADTVPAPTYLSAMAGAAGVAEDPGGGVTVLVGRRRHVDLSGWGADRVVAWLRDPGRPAPPALADPVWLQDGYRDTADLRAGDDTSFRYVIGAVLGVPRAVWQTTGGFDESFRHYGGEDWELAQRCWLAGADLRHLPHAVAWHDGPDLTGRGDQMVTAKNVETAHLARRLTHPLVRGTGLRYAVPDIVVEADVTHWSLAQTVLCAEALLRGSDVGLWLVGLDGPAQDALAEDPAVHGGAPSPEVLQRCRYRVRLRGPVVLTQDSLADVVDDDAPAGLVELASTRAVGRAALHRTPAPAPRGPRPDRVRPIPVDALVERWRQPGLTWSGRPNHGAHRS